jgi:hypothetical protein
MATLGEYATYKIGNKRFSYDANDYFSLLLQVSDQEETIQKLQSQLKQSNGKKQ